MYELRCSDTVLGRIDRFGGDAVQTADLSRQGGDDVAWRVERHTDDIHALFAVRHAHTPDDILPVLVQQLVERLDEASLADDDGQHGDSRFH